MNTVFVTSTEYGTGKTAVAIALARHARERGFEVGYMKPKGTQLRSVVGKVRDTDIEFASDVLDLDHPIETIQPVAYSDAFLESVLRGERDPDAVKSEIQDAYETIAADADLVLVEGGGRLSTGAAVSLSDDALADRFDARVLLVSWYEQLADLDDIIASADTVGDRLVGVLFNVVSDPSRSEIDSLVTPYLDDRDVETVGSLPRDVRLRGTTVDVVVDRLDATTLTSGVDLDGRVERFTIGSMGSTSAFSEFRRTAATAVVVRGDRADVQRVALEAPGVRCLIVTGGRKPARSILGLAEERDVPVLLVDSDTRTTVDRLENVLSERARTAEQIDRMQAMLAEHVDVDELLDL